MKPDTILNAITIVSMWTLYAFTLFRQYRSSGDGNFQPSSIDLDILFTLSRYDRLTEEQLVDRMFRPVFGRVLQPILVNLVDRRLIRKMTLSIIAGSSGCVRRRTVFLITPLGRAAYRLHAQTRSDSLDAC